jgi:cellobiose phosphorylase
MWRQVRFVRPFRGTNFEIHVRRGKQARIRVEGKPIEGDFIPVPRKGLGKATVHIRCEVKS